MTPRVYIELLSFFFAAWVTYGLLWGGWAEASFKMNQEAKGGAFWRERKKLIILLLKGIMVTVFLIHIILSIRRLTNYLS